MERFQNVAIYDGLNLLNKRTSRLSRVCLGLIGVTLGHARQCGTNFSLILARIDRHVLDRQHCFPAARNNLVEYLGLLQERQQVWHGLCALCAVPNTAKGENSGERVLIAKKIKYMCRVCVGELR